MRVSLIGNEAYQAKSGDISREWLNKIKKGTRKSFTVIKSVSKVQPLYLEVKLKEAKLDW